MIISYEKLDSPSNEPKNMYPAPIIGNAIGPGNFAANLYNSLLFQWYCIIYTTKTVVVNINKISLNVKR